MEKRLRKRIDRAANASLFIYAVAAVALPVCLVQITEELKLSFTQAGSFGFISSLVQFIFLILSGFIAARFGKIRILKAALVILAIGLLLFTGASSYIIAVNIIIIIGIGTAFLEALLTPLVENLYPEDNGSKQNLLHAFWPMGVIISTLIVGELLSRGIIWRWIYGGISAGVLIVLLFYPSAKKVSLPRSRSDFSHIKDIFKQPKFFIMLLALFFAGGAEGAFTFWLASYIQLNLGELPRSGGLGTAFFALGVFLGRIIMSRLVLKFNLKRIIQISIFLAILTSLFFFFADNLWTIYILVFFAGLTIACFWPSIQTYTVRVIPMDPTLIMILLSCFGIIGFSSTPLIIGIIGDITGLKTGFIIVPVFLVLLFITMLLESKIPFRPINNKRKF